MGPLKSTRPTRRGRALLWTAGLLTLAPGASLRTVFETGFWLDEHTPLANLPLNREKSEQLAQALQPGVEPELDAALAFAFEFTDDSLSFSATHETSRHFPRGPREGNSIEYAHLFAAAFNAAASHAALNAYAQPVRSRATLFDRPMPLDGWERHDWVLIRTAEGVRYVDPTLHDVWILDWDISRNVAPLETPAT